MGVFRRPELEKDNPVAPQMYVGPRRRLALARASTPQISAQDAVVKVLQVLTVAAERFVATVPASKKPHKARTVLLKAIAQAQRHLPDEPRR
ncbi:MAG: hypothetical protein LZF86_40010 [Nitrospira sp.]|nr:MAG: hypothetical protein LZF86_40010 [Nitrospira sp.]